MERECQYSQLCSTCGCRYSSSLFPPVGSQPQHREADLCCCLPVDCECGSSEARHRSERSGESLDGELDYSSDEPRNSRSTDSCLLLPDIPNADDLQPAIGLHIHPW